MSVDRYWSSTEGRWVYDDENVIKAKALREAAESPRWASDEHRHVRDWLRERADEMEEMH